MLASAHLGCPIFAGPPDPRPSTVYVSPNGRDTWSGTLPTPNPPATDGPLLTPLAARNRVRELRHRGSAGPVTISLRGGAYPLTDTLVLTSEDSNTTYTAYPGERAIISGGSTIGPWKNNGDHHWTAPVSGHPRDLFIDGRRAQPARLPVNGFYRINGPSSQQKPFTLKYRAGEIHKAWENRNVEVVALLAWAELRMPIVSVDESTRTATFAANPQPSNREDNARYFVQNVPEGLAAPGAWVYDDTQNTVTYHALAGEDLTQSQAIIPRLKTLVRLDGAHDLALKNLDFSYAAWDSPAAGYAEIQAAIGAPSALEAANAHNVSIDHCTIAHNGGYAVWLRHGSSGNRITNNEIFDMGAGGVKVGETANPSTPDAQVTGNQVTDNDIHDLGFVSPSAVGVWIGQASDCAILHNHIHHLDYTAISVGWTWGYGPTACARNHIAWNNLHDIGQGILSDMGAIYTLGVQPGTTIRNNLIHDVVSFSYGGWGIYTDEGSSGILIENNIVYRTRSGGFHQHYGRDNIVRNNIFAFGTDFQLRRSRDEPHLSFTFENNIFYYDQGSLLDGTWTGQYKMGHNLYWNVSGKAPALPPNDQDSLIADPLFRNPSSYDFHLQPGSPAEKIGFHPIDLTAVGPAAF